MQFYSGPLIHFLSGVDTGALAGRFGGEEWLEQLVFDLRDNAGAVVAYADLDCIAEISRRYLQGRLELRVASFLLTFSGGVEAVAEQVETNAGNVLWHQFDRGNAMSEISLQRDVEALILG